MLLQGICVYNYNPICEVHVMEIKTMTEGYDRPLSTDHSANVKQYTLRNYKYYSFAVISIGFR